MANKGEQHTGGRGGIRTHGTLAGTPVFKTGALNHSATLPTDEIAKFFGSAWRQIEPVAARLLPFIFSALVYGGAEHSVNRGGCAFLHMAPVSGLVTTASWPSLDEGLFCDRPRAPGLSRAWFSIRRIN